MTALHWVARPATLPERHPPRREARQSAILDRLAADEGVSRSEVISRLIDHALAGREVDLGADLAAVDESFGVLRDDGIPARGGGDREEHLARMWRVVA